MPNVSAEPRSLQNGNIVREFVDTTSSSSTTYTYPVQQSRLVFENSSDYDMYITVGSYTDKAIKPNEIWEVDETFTSFSIRSDIKSQEFVATAFQYGIAGGIPSDVAQQLQDLTSSLAQNVHQLNDFKYSYSYYADGSVQTITEKDKDDNTFGTTTFNYLANGDVDTSVKVMNGQTITTKYNYDVNGNLQSTVNTKA